MKDVYKRQVEGKRRNIGRVVNKLQFLHNGNQVVFHYTFILEDDHGPVSYTHLEVAGDSRNQILVPASIWIEYLSECM